MQNTTADYKIEINKPSRSFECRITIGNNIYTNEDLVNLTLEYTQPQEGFAIGSTVSQSLDLTILNKGDIIYSTSQIKVEIGLKIGSKIEYILMGIFNIDDIEKTDYTTKFTAYDNMIKFEKTFTTSLGNTLTLQQVVSELTRITGVEFTGSLPNYNVNNLEGFTCREVLSYVASICGGNAFITRDGKFTIKSLGEVERSIDGSNYFEYKREEVKYKVGQISCQVDENNILSKGSIGTDSMELGFENPWVTESILNDIYNKLNGLSYLGYSMKWQGDISLDPYDIITVTDVKNVVRKIPILSQKLTYTGGLTSEIGAKGETKNKNSFSSSGSTTNKVNRLVTEQAVIKEALIDKANINDLEVTNAKVENLEVKTAKIEEAIIDVAYVSDLTAINANIQTLFANDATINNALIGKAEITDLNAIKGTINVLESDTANIKNLLAGNITGESGQLIHLTASNVVIADAVIKDLIAANISVEDLKAGRISTTKFTIASDDGGITIVGPTMQFKDKSNKVRLQLGQDTTGDFNCILRASDGTTTLIDGYGIKEKAIADDLIKSNMVAENAIGEKQINYSSLITGLNKDTNTSLIKASKVAIDLTGQTLDVVFNSLESSITGLDEKIKSNTTSIGIAQGKIDGLISENTIIKGDITTISDKYTSLTATLDGISTTVANHTSSIGTINTNISGLSGKVSTVENKYTSLSQNLEGFKTTVSSNYSTKSELSGVDGKVTSLTNRVSTAEGSITQLKDQIKLKVEATDVTEAIDSAITTVDTKITTTNNKVASIEASLNSITQRVSSTESKINTANNNISNLQTRMSSAESKITSTAIINTVQSTINNAKNEAINSANSSTDSKLKNYATTSSLTQTSDSLVAKFTSNGGYNLLKNGLAKNGTYGWSVWEYSLAGSNLNRVFNVRNDSWSNYEPAFQVHINSMSSGEYGFQQSFPTVIGKKYVFTCYLAGHRSNKNVIIRGTTSNATGWLTNKSFGALQGGTSLSDWTKVTIPFTAQRTTTIVNLVITSTIGTDGYMWAKELMVSEGDSWKPYSPHPSEIYEGSTIIDGSGITVNNGALTIKNKAGTTVFTSDTNGNLIFTGTAKSQQGNQWVGLSSGGIDFQDWNKKEQLMRIGISSFPDNIDMNGLTFAMPQYSDFVRFAHINKPDLTDGWSSSDTQYPFFDLWSSDQVAGTIQRRKGMTVYCPLYINNSIRLFSESEFFPEILGGVYWNNGTGTVQNMLGVYGDNGTALGYKDGKGLNARIIVTEFPHPGTNDTIISWGNWNCNGYIVHNGTFVGSHVNSYSNTTTRTFTETTCIEAEYSQVRVNFEDIQLVNGQAILNIPKAYIGINNGYIINSIVKKGAGDVWVDSEEENRFIIKGDNDIKVNIELIIKINQAITLALNKEEPPVFNSNKIGA